MAQSIFIAAKEGDEISGIVQAFQNYRYDVVVAHEGEEALRLLKSSAVPAAILLNSSLEKIGTLDLCKHIKEAKRFLKTPILIMESQKMDRKEYQALGVADFFEKPFSTSLLLGRIKSLAADRVDADQRSPVGIKQQMMYVIIALVLFLGLMSYYILFPMFFHAK